SFSNSIFPNSPSSNNFSSRLQIRFQSASNLYVHNYKNICGASDSGNMLFGRSFSNRALPERTSLLSECQ
ncbi:hypothetical protein LINPERHAP1_LOCUS24285, partial [Linum perenne]